MVKTGINDVSRTAAQELLDFRIGDYVCDTGYGLGRITYIGTRFLTIKTRDKGYVKIPIQHAQKRMKRIPPNGFKALLIDGQVLKLQEEHAKILSAILRDIRSNEFRKKEIYNILVPDFLKKSEWKRWWNKASLDLKGKGIIQKHPKKRDIYLIVRPGDEELIQDYVKRFQNLKEERAKGPEPKIETTKTALIKKFSAEPVLNPKMIHTVCSCFERDFRETLDHSAFPLEKRESLIALAYLNIALSKCGQPPLKFPDLDLKTLDLSDITDPVDAIAILDWAYKTNYHDRSKLASIFISPSLELVKHVIDFLQDYDEGTLQGIISRALDCTNLNDLVILASALESNWVSMLPLTDQVNIFKAAIRCLAIAKHDRPPTRYYDAVKKAIKRTSESIVVEQIYSVCKSRLSESEIYARIIVENFDKFISPAEVIKEIDDLLDKCASTPWEGLFSKCVEKLREFAIDNQTQQTEDFRVIFRLITKAHRMAEKSFPEEAASLSDLKVSIYKAELARRLRGKSAVSEPSFIDQELLESARRFLVEEEQERERKIETLTEKINELTEEVEKLTKEKEELAHREKMIAGKFELLKASNFVNAERADLKSKLHLVAKIIPVLDDIEEHIRKTTGRKAEPLRFVQARLQTILTAEGIIKIDSIGDEVTFDPEKYEALEEHMSIMVGDEAIVLRPCYVFRGSAEEQVIRRGLVRVKR